MSTTLNAVISSQNANTGDYCETLFCVRLSLRVVCCGSESVSTYPVHLCLVLVQ